MEQNENSVIDNNEKKKITFDNVIEATGKFGSYQRRIYFILCLPLLPCAFHTMAGVFMAANTDFRCLLPYENKDNATYELSPYLAGVLNPLKNSSENWPQCEKYDVNNITDFVSNISSIIPTAKCEHFIYDKTTYELTVITEFDLVCDYSWMKATSDSLFMLGVMLGALIFGSLSDRFGRKPTLCLTLFFETIIGFLVALSPDVTSYVIFRLLLASTTSGSFLIIYVTAVEMVVPEKRLMLGIGVEIFYTTGYVLTTLFAYFITNWRFLQIAITVPNIAFLVYWWFIPESTRWLVTTGRIERAKESIRKSCSLNGVELSDDKLDAMLSECGTSNPDEKKSSIIDLLRYPSLRRRSLLLFFNWFMNNSTYYGLSWNTSSLVGNEYLNFAIAGLVEMPAHLIVFFTLNKWGRKKILCSSMIVAGTSLLLTTIVPRDMSWLTVVFTMIGKLAITASYAAVYIFTAEQYPTVIRNVGIGACSTCARVGGILAPYINYSSTYWTHLPAVLFGVGSLIGGLSTLLLPETLGKNLPESMEDGEKLGKKIKGLRKSSIA